MPVSRTILLGLVCVYLAGCATLSREAKKQNISTTLDPKLVEGMTLMKDWPIRGSFGWGPSDIASLTANDLATKDGYSNTVVLVELVDPGHVVGNNSYGRGAIWKVSIYKPKTE